MNTLFAVACLRTGIVLELLGPGDQMLDAEQLAAILPQLFNAPATDWGAIFSRLGAEAGDAFQDIVLVTDARVHVVQRLREPAETALIAVAEGTTNVGLVLSSVRAKVAEIEAR
ncbi:MAG: hypothetical protein QM756_33780 [Polyangiaceae bacterium]